MHQPTNESVRPSLRASLPPLLTLLALPVLLLAAACSGGTPPLPTPNPQQAAAMTALAQGTRPGEVPTKVARAVKTTAPENMPAPETGQEPTRTPRAKAAQAQATRPAATQAPPAEEAAPEEEEIEPTATPPALPRVKPIKLNSPEYSVQAFMWYRPEIADRDMNMVKAMGFSWVKQQFAWRDIEGAKKGAFDWSRSDEVIYAANYKGLDVLARLDNSPDWAAPGCYDPATSSMGPPRNTSDWTDFLRAFVTRYKGRVRGYQIWNEPNLAREWCKRPPDPAAYARFLQASYRTIKAIDPNAIVISGGLTPTTCCADGGQALPDIEFFRRMYDAMGNNSDGYFDVLGVHAAGYKAEPEADPGVVANDPVLTNNDPSSPELKRIYCFRHVEDVRALMVERGDGDKQIAILEFGWTSDPVNPAYAWFRVDENEKADRIVRAYQYAQANWSPWIGVMSLIYMANADWPQSDEKFWWAITEPDGTPRPAYNALKAMTK